MKKNSAAVMSAAISLIVMLLASSQATLTFASSPSFPPSSGAVPILSESRPEPTRPAPRRPGSGSVALLRGHCQRQNGAEHAFRTQERAAGPGAGPVARLPARDRVVARARPEAGRLS